MDRLEILTQVTQTLLKQTSITIEEKSRINEIYEGIVNHASIITSLILKKEQEMDVAEEDNNDTAEMNQIMMDNPVTLNREMMNSYQLPEAARTAEQLRLPSVVELQQECEDCEHEEVLDDAHRPNSTVINKEESPVTTPPQSEPSKKVTIQSDPLW